MAPRAMRAVAVISPGVVEIVEDIPIPEPGEYEALAKIHSCGFCSGTDGLIISGETAGTGSYGPLPTILGHEAAGEVIRIGKKVRNIQVGDRVINPMLPEGISDRYSLTWGCMSEYGIVSDRRAMLEDGRGDLPYFEKQCIFPSAIDFTDAGVLLSLSECHSAIANFAVSAGHEVLIYGAGPMGIALGLFAKMAGASRVVQIDAIPDRLERAKRVACVDQTINFALEETESVFGNQTFDLIIDAVGRSSILVDSCRRLKQGGTIGSLGVLAHKDTRIDVSLLKNNTRLHMLNYPHGEYESMPKVVDLIQNGLLNPRDFYTHAMPFTQVHHAIDLVKSRTALKVVLTF